MHPKKQKKQAIKGIESENNRTVNDRPVKAETRFPQSEIDWERTHLNYALVENHDWNTFIENALKEHGIEHVRKDAVVMVDVIYTASPEFFKDKTDAEIRQYFENCLEFHKTEYGNTVINAVVHLDQSTPHMHVTGMPILAYEKDGDVKYKLSAKELMGNRAKYSKRQDRFYEQVSNPWGLERGEIKTAERRAEEKTILEHHLEQLENEVSKKEARIKELEQIEEKTIEETDFVLRKKIEASRIKTPFFKSKTDVEMYHKGSLAQAQNIADDMLNHMKDNRYFYSHDISVKDEAEKRILEAERKETEIEPLYQQAISERDKWRDANKHMDELIERKADEKAREKIKTLTNGHDIDLTNCMENFLNQLQLPNGNALELFRIWYEKQLERVADFILE